MELMAADYSTDGLLDFLRESALAGRMHPALARSRHKAAEALFAHLSQEEAADLRALDLDSLRGRLADLPRGNLRPEVVELYTERLSGALDDYFAATRDGVPSRPAGGAGGADGEDPGAADRRALEGVRLSFNRHRDDVIPVPLAPDRVIYLHGVPADLTPSEARKVARVLEALAWDGSDEP